MKKIVINKALSAYKAPDTSDCLVTTAPGEGNMRLNENTAIALGIDYKTVNSTPKGELGVRIEVVTMTVEGEEVKAICLANNGTEKTGNGSKLAVPGKTNSGSLTFNSKSIWATLNGSDENLEEYTILPEKNIVGFNEDDTVVTVEEAIEGGYLDADGCVTAEGEGIFAGLNGEELTVGDRALVYFPLTFSKTKTKAKRVKQAKKSEKNEDVSAEDAEKEVVVVGDAQDAFEDDSEF